MHQVDLLVNACDEILERKPYAGKPHVRFDEGVGEKRSENVSMYHFRFSFHSTLPGA